MVITCLVHLIVDEVDRESRDLTRRMNMLAQKHNLNTKGLDTSTQEFLQKPQRRKGLFFFNLNFVHVLLLKLQMFNVFASLPI